MLCRIVCSQAARVAGKFVRDKTYVPRLLCSLQYYRAEAQHRLSLEALTRVLKLRTGWLQCAFKLEWA